MLVWFWRRGRKGGSLELEILHVHLAIEVQDSVVAAAAAVDLKGDYLFLME